MAGSWCKESLTKGFTVIVAISLTYMVLKFIDLLMSFWHLRAEAQEDQAFNQQLFPDHPQEPEAVHYCRGGPGDAG